MSKSKKLVVEKNNSTSKNNYKTNFVNILFHKDGRKFLYFLDCDEKLSTAQIDDSTDVVIECHFVSKSMMYFVDIDPCEQKDDLVTVYGYDYKEFCNSIVLSIKLGIFKAPKRMLETKIPFSLVKNLVETVNVFTIIPAKELGDDVMELVMFNTVTIKELLKK